MSKKIRPVSRIVKIEAEINRIVDEMFSHEREIYGLDESWVPWIDISEKQNEIIVEVELPGTAQKDITIMLSSNRVEIKGIKRRSRFMKQVKYLRFEREYGPFRRLIFLPGAVIPEKAHATFENGVLTLVLKKYRGSKGKKVVLEIER
jgi:HSP20 family protein